MPSCIFLVCSDEDDHDTNSGKLPLSIINSVSYLDDAEEIKPTTTDTTDDTLTGKSTHIGSTALPNDGQYRRKENLGSLASGNCATFHEDERAQVSLESRCLFLLLHLVTFTLWLERGDTS